MTRHIQVQPGQEISCCWGDGVDSTAGIIMMKRQGLRPAKITMADTGGESKASYDFIPIFTGYCKDIGFPEPEICVYTPAKPETMARYVQAAVEACVRLGIDVATQNIERLGRLYGNMVANATLPGVAFDVRSCSAKWKLMAQEPI